MATRTSLSWRVGVYLGSRLVARRCDGRSAALGHAALVRHDGLVLLKVDLAVAICIGEVDERVDLPGRGHATWSAIWLGAEGAAASTGKPLRTCSSLRLPFSLVMAERSSSLSILPLPSESICLNAASSVSSERSLEFRRLRLKPPSARHTDAASAASAISECSSDSSSQRSLLLRRNFLMSFVWVSQPSASELAPMVRLRSCSSSDMKAGERGWTVDCGKGTPSNYASA